MNKKIQRISSSAAERKTLQNNSYMGEHDFRLSCLTNASFPALSGSLLLGTNRQAAADRAAPVYQERCEFSI